jgi:hypothetical protein
MAAGTVKGDEVTFIKGKYVGYKGWINVTGDETASSVPVIVHGWKKADGSTVDRETNVRKTSIRKGSPPTRAEAIMLQRPEIEALMDTLCRQLAKFELNDNSIKSIHIMFARKLQEAVANQIAQGSKATWYRIRYRPSEFELDDNSIKSIHAIFARKLQEAIAKQIALGSKATWYRITYGPSGM